MNQVAILGNLTYDPELKHTNGGTAVTKFTVAINDKIKGPDGKYTERSDFVECSLFGKSAETFCEYMAKGRKVAVTGKLRTDTWDDKETGKKRSRTFVMVDQWFMCDSKSQGKPKADDAPPPDDDAPF